MQSTAQLKSLCSLYSYEINEDLRILEAVIYGTINGCILLIFEQLFSQSPLQMICTFYSPFLHFRMFLTV